MSQHVTVTTDIQVEFKSLVQSALRSEVRVLELGLERTRQRLRGFEERYNLTSDEFMSRFEAGAVDDSLDFIEWAGEVKTYHLLEIQRQALQGARVHYAG